MEFKNTWTRIAARWNDEDQNKVNIDVNAAEFCGSFEYNIGFLANKLTQSNFVNSRIKKISDTTFNVFETDGTYYILIENGYDISDNVHEDEYFNVSPKNIDELTTVINDIGNNISKYNNYMDKLINSFQQNKNDKIKNYKIVKKLEKFKNTVNQFYQLLSKEYSNIQKFKPFYIIINNSANYICNIDLNAAKYEDEIEKYDSFDAASYNISDIGTTYYIKDENGNEVEKQTGFTDDDYEIWDINNMKEYNNLLKKYNIKRK